MSDHALDEEELVLCRRASVALFVLGVYQAIIGASDEWAPPCQKQEPVLNPILADKGQEFAEGHILGVLVHFPALLHRQFGDVSVVKVSRRVTWVIEGRLFPVLVLHPVLRSCVSEEA